MVANFNTVVPEINAAQPMQDTRGSLQKAATSQARRAVRGFAWRKRPVKGRLGEDAHDVREVNMMAL